MADPVIAIIGAGPAGLRAAQVLAEAGLRPLLIDEGHRAGGQIYRRPPPGAERPAAALYGFEAGRAQALHDLADALAPRIGYRPGTMVWGIATRGSPGFDLDCLGPGGHDRIPADRLVLATGAMDRTLPFPGWTLPGVFTLGAAQIALKAQGMTIGRRVALVGAGPLLPLVAHQYAKAGAEIAAVLDVTPLGPKVQAAPRLAAMPATLAKGVWYTLRGALRGLPVRSGVRAVAVEGDVQVEALAWEDSRGRRQRVACDAVGASFGLRSEAQAADLAGCRFVFEPVTRQWQPERSPEGRASHPHVYLAGDGSGIGGADVAELQGERTALTLLADLGRPRDAAREARLDRTLARQAGFRAALEAAYPYPHHLIAKIGDDEIVCRCEGITAGALRRAATERDAREMNRLKALTRAGMGRCQGRVCGHAAAEILADHLHVPVETVGRLRGQAPIKPIPMREPA
ncbi:NAD(P)/FAD-dependent oxidoreductase [Methylobacterium frigidaeris]|uniref:Hydrogen cyanide synthase subunit HcnB n=1 Tax=Methylobacterium frigidaeris TaxID=2038277 RepID=A0AA37M7P2_9HYPH|nr:NAD(P)/FAD-dependent oxidoreductase [Methylobacterium frigidaeris]PIK71939.1 FAD/NAD(P)-binding oxidoreductase [Methylobacterium frigidaeris]GJD66188.1 Hydrogen cyanide synthase subunit HcnB [Methylobacterium frigidaeris]